MVIKLLETMDQYSLKWNDFQNNVSKSFNSLRQEEHFFDVTLVSDDEEHISAHKVVLSASSEFFKNILKKSSHRSPMIFLSGVNSKDLLSIMDYIYQGEVQLFQDDLDCFLATAKKLKIDGLTGEEINTKQNEQPEPKIEEESIIEDDVATSITGNIKTESNEKRTVATSNTNINAKAAIDELVMKINDGWQCRTCGKVSYQVKCSDIRRHVEIHIEGLSYQCNICSKSFRSRRILSQHKHNHHKTH